MEPTAAAAHGAGENPYGLMAALEQGGTIAWATFLILVFMSVVSWYILFVKFYEQQKILNQGKALRRTCWPSGKLKEAANKLDKNSAWRQIVDDGLLASDQHGRLTDPVDQHEWVHGSLARSQAAVASKLGGGLAFLATVGSTSPFIGLFGTVIGIYRALIKIGAAGQASIDAVAGPVGEALIMTALGLAVAVPAVLSYNWLIRRNKSVLEQLGAFSTDIYGYMMSNGALRPVSLAGAGGNAVKNPGSPATITPSQAVKSPTTPPKP